VFVEVLALLVVLAVALVVFPPLSMFWLADEVAFAVVFAVVAAFVVVALAVVFPPLSMFWLAVEVVFAAVFAVVVALAVVFAVVALAVVFAVVALVAPAVTVTVWRTVLMLTLTAAHSVCGLTGAPCAVKLERERARRARQSVLGNMSFEAVKRELNKVNGGR
jgi:hypothetical protein